MLCEKCNYEEAYFEVDYMEDGELKGELLCAECTDEVNFTAIIVPLWYLEGKEEPKWLTSLE